MRARIIVTLAAMLCVMPQACPAWMFQPKSTSPLTARHSKGPLAVTVPFEYYRRHIYVTVSLQGEPGFVFMLDSGANRNILNLRTSKELGIQPRSLRQEKDIGFGDAPVYAAPEENVNAAVGSVPVAHQMAVIDLAKFEHHFGHPTDGMLGYPFFRSFVVKVDFQTKLLSIFPAAKYSYRGLGVQVPLKPSKDFVIMPVTLGSDRSHRHQIDVAVDTGCDATMMLYEQFVRRLDLEESRRASIDALAFGLNGFYPIARGSIDFFLIGDEGANNLPVDYLTETKKAASQRNFPAAIGNGILQSFRTVIFDVPQGQMILELEPPPLALGTTRTIMTDPHDPH